MKKVIGMMVLIVVSVCMWTTRSIAEEVINFEDLSGGVSIPDNYKGMTWTNWKYMDNDSRYTPHSGTITAYTTKADNLMAWESPVDFNGAWFVGSLTSITATTIQFEGYLNDYLQVTSDTMTVSAAPQFLAANFKNIDSIKVVSNRIGYFAMDDVAYSVVPEPLSMILFGVGGLTMVILKKRAYKKS